MTATFKIRSKLLMNYETQNLKVPVESDDYNECSAFVIEAVKGLMTDALNSGRNKILIHTNLKRGLPMENINKVAGPFVEAWAVEVFQEAVEDQGNKYRLINVEAQERLNISDVILQFKRQRKRQTSVTAGVDVKATSEDFKNAGKSPNITSYARIRTAYVKDPDYLFVILSLKHRVYCEKNQNSAMMEGVMEEIGRAHV